MNSDSVAIPSYDFAVPIYPERYCLKCTRSRRWADHRWNLAVVEPTLGRIGRPIKLEYPMNPRLAMYVFGVLCLLYGFSYRIDRLAGRGRVLCHRAVCDAYFIGRHERNTNKNGGYGARPPA